MTKEQMDNLQNGDIVQHVQTGEAHIIIQRMGQYSIAVRSVVISNPLEWKLMYHTEPVAELSQGLTKRSS